jgi:hypothetical protein
MHDEVEGPDYYASSGVVYVGALRDVTLGVGRGVAGLLTTHLRPLLTRR